MLTSPSSEDNNHGSNYGPTRGKIEATLESVLCLGEWKGHGLGVGLEI